MHLPNALVISLAVCQSVSLFACLVPEQFIVKAQPALFEGEGGAKNGGTLLLQSTVDIHIQNQTLKSNISKWYEIERKRQWK